MKKYKEAILYTVSILLIFGYVVTKTYPQILNLISIEKNIGSKSSQVADLERKLETLKTAEAEKATVTGQAKNIYKPEATGLDAESSFTVVFDDIIEMAKYNGVKIYSIEYAYNPPEDDFIKGAPNQYNVCQLSMDIIADYADLESFLKELYKYPYLINIDNIGIKPYPKNKKILLIDLEMKLYSSK